MRTVCIPALILLMLVNGGPGWFIIVLGIIFYCFTFFMVFADWIPVLEICCRSKDSVELV